jgi:hypothetical protein
MHEMGVCGVLACCADDRCGHRLALNADCWLDDMRLSDLERRFVSKTCGRRGADVRPDFERGKPPMVLTATDHMNQQSNGKSRSVVPAPTAAFPAEIEPST